MPSNHPRFPWDRFTEPKCSKDHSWQVVEDLMSLLVLSFYKHMMLYYRCVCVYVMNERFRQKMLSTYGLQRPLTLDHRLFQFLPHCYSLKRKEIGLKWVWWRPLHFHPIFKFHNVDKSIPVRGIFMVESGGEWLMLQSGRETGDSALQKLQVWGRGCEGTCQGPASVPVTM